VAISAALPLEFARPVRHSWLNHEAGSGNQSCTCVPHFTKLGNPRL